MTNLNKYGEVDECLCPECSSAIERNWKACPSCGSRLGQAQKLVNEQGRVHSGRVAGASYVCPGCGDEATARDGKLCTVCMAFVHKECLNKGKKVKRSAGERFCGHEKWEAVCPLCSFRLGTISRFEVMGGDYAEEIDDSDP